MHELTRIGRDASAHGNPLKPILQIREFVHSVSQRYSPLLRFSQGVQRLGFRNAESL